MGWVAADAALTHPFQLPGLLSDAGSVQYNRKTLDGRPFVCQTCTSHVSTSHRQRSEPSLGSEREGGWPDGDCALNSSLKSAFSCTHSSGLS